MLYNARIPSLAETSVTLSGDRYGASSDASGPIGGGAGYTNGVPVSGNPARTLDELTESLAAARAGDVVFLDGRAVIECTERVFVEALVLELPGGVTLASDRGVTGSSGALIRSDTFATRPLIRVMGPDARITGLRLSGPNPRRCIEHHTRSFAEGRGHEYYYRFPIASGIQTEHARLEVDNCELAGWSHSAVHLIGGDGHRIHHAFLHHNQYNGLGYGVSHDQASSHIHHNLFNHNRHSIAGTGRPGCAYEASDNVEIGTSLSHCFDMHGGRDRKDGTNTAGSWMKVHHNTFRCRKPALKVRGVPEESIAVDHNWFTHADITRAVIAEDGLHCGKNAFSLTSPRVS